MIYLIITMFMSILHAQVIKVAVIDTGLDPKYKEIRLCKDGHRDFTDTQILDVNGHGSNVSYLINKHANRTDYCQIIIKYYSPHKRNNLGSMIRALNHVASLDVDIVNISAGGTDPSELERKLIMLLLQQGKILVVATGNDKVNLDNNCTYYPACYDKQIIVVGNGVDKKPLRGSNYGDIVDLWIDGVEKGPDDLKMTGSSQATAIATGRIINKMVVNKNAKCNR